MTLRKRIKHGLVYLLLRAFQGLVFFFPVRTVLWFGARVGRWAGRFLRKERALAVAQIGEMLPEINAEETAEAMFAHLGALVAEVLLGGRLRDQIEEYVTLSIQDRATLRGALLGAQPTIIVSAHAGNWELMAQRLFMESDRDRPAATIVKQNTNPYFASWLSSQRRKGGVATIARGGEKTARQILSTLKKKGALGILIDQDTSVPSVHVPFFGRLAKTPSAAAELAIRFDASILVAVSRRKIWGHEISLSKLPNLRRTGDKGEQVTALTSLMTAQIEAAIKKQPHTWVWFHERWKSPPESRAPVIAQGQGRGM